MCVHLWTHVKIFVHACACEYVRIYADVVCLHLCMYVYLWVLANECEYDCVHVYVHAFPKMGKNFYTHSFIVSCVLLSIYC